MISNTTFEDGFVVHGVDSGESVPYLGNCRLKANPGATRIYEQNPGVPPFSSQNTGEKSVFLVVVSEMPPTKICRLRL